MPREYQPQQKRATIPRERLILLTRHIHRLGPRPLYELFRELDAGAPLWPRLERFAETDRNVVKHLGADALPPPARPVRQ